MDSYHGCNKFTTKQHAHHVNHVQATQEQSALDQFNNMWNHHQKGAEPIPYMTNKYLQPFVDDSNYLAEATMAAEEKLVMQKNNRLKQQAYIASSAAHQQLKRPATT